MSTGHQPGDDVEELVYNETPGIVKLYRKLVIKTLQKPIQKVLRYLLWVALVVGIVVTFTPMRILHYFNSFHWTKIAPLFMNRGGWNVWRGFYDWFYMILVERLRIVYIILKIAVSLVLLPIVIAYRIFGNINRVRVIIIMTALPQLLAFLATLTASLFKVREKYNNRIRYNNIISLFSYGFIALFAVISHRNMPGVYRFMFDTLSPMGVFMMCLAIWTYVSMSLVIYVDSYRDKSSGDIGKRELINRRKHLTVAATSALVIGVYLVMASNPPFFERMSLMDPRACPAE
jgi:hypothetical protein